MFEKLKSLIVDQMGVPEAAVTLDASFEEDLGADSLDTFELIMGLEEAFDIEMPEEDLVDMKTVGDVVNYLQRKLDL
ncbi:MAG: acyl carrier protein [Ruminiclostridium sp.]|nr:acyl carrier protein [Ruminiclostridium sp.]